MDDHPSHPQFQRNVANTNSLLIQLTLAQLLRPSLEDICSIHAALFEGIGEGTGVVDSVPGVLKECTTFITLAGNEYLHHCPPKELRTAYGEFLNEMAELQAELSKLLEPGTEPVGNLQKLRYIAAFHARFMYLHPFSDGNGRVARALAVGQLGHLFERGLHVFRDLSYLNRDMRRAPLDLMVEPCTDQTRTAYLAAMRAAERNLVYLVRYFNLFDPALKLPAHVPPPTGKVIDKRNHPPF